MTSKIDRTDQVIVCLLMEDGRMSYAEIARRIGSISERSVRSRIERLVREGVIRVSAVVNPRTVGLPVTADVWMEIEPGRVQDVAQRMAEREEVSYVAYSTGDRDLSIQIYAADNDELYRFVSEVVGNVPGVRRTSTIMVPRVLKDVYDWRIPNSACEDEKEDDV